MRRVLCALLMLVGLVVPATVHAAPAPTYASTDTATDFARSYVGARYYASQNGRFTAADDPSYMAPFDPQSMDRYAYAYNNPLIGFAAARAEYSATRAVAVLNFKSQKY